MDDVAAGLDLTVICGRYGGMDERVWTELATEAVSPGTSCSRGEIVAAALLTLRSDVCTVSWGTRRASSVSRSRQKMWSALHSTRVPPTGPVRRFRTCSVRQTTRGFTPGGKRRHA